MARMQASGSIGLQRAAAQWCISQSRDALVSAGAQLTLDLVLCCRSHHPRRLGGLSDCSCRVQLVGVIRSGALWPERRAAETVAGEGWQREQHSSADPRPEEEVGLWRRETGDGQRGEGITRGSK